MDSTTQEQPADAGESGPQRAKWLERVLLVGWLLFFLMLFRASAGDGSVPGPIDYCLGAVVAVWMIAKFGVYARTVLCDHTCNPARTRCWIGIGTLALVAGAIAAPWLLGLEGLTDDSGLWMALFLCLAAAALLALVASFVIGLAGFGMGITGDAYDLSWHIAGSCDAAVTSTFLFGIALVAGAVGGIGH